MIDQATCTPAEATFQFCFPARSVEIHFFFKYAPTGIRNDQMHGKTVIQQFFCQPYAVNAAAGTSDAQYPVPAGAYEFVYQNFTTKSINVKTKTMLLSQLFIVKKAVCTRLKSLGFTMRC